MIEMSIQAYQILEYFFLHEEAHHSFKGIYEKETSEVFLRINVTLLIVMVIINFIWWLGNTYLVLFHIYIKIKGITTYDYIMR